MKVSPIKHTLEDVQVLIAKFRDDIKDFQQGKSVEGFDYADAVKKLMYYRRIQTRLSKRVKKDEEST
jgi:hypothetical protein